jgi:hypothetical protein
MGRRSRSSDRTVAAIAVALPFGDALGARSRGLLSRDLIRAFSLAYSWQ